MPKKQAPTISFPVVAIGCHGGSNMSLVSMCQQPYARANSTDPVGDPSACDCNGGYSGPYCHTQLAWWLPVQWSLFVVALCSMVVVFVWSVLKAVHFFVLQQPSTRATTPGRTFNIAGVSLVLNVFGNTMRLIFRSIPQTPLLMNYAAPPNVALQATLVIINTLAMAAWIASFAIILGFWADALYSKMHVVMARRTKVLCLVAAAFVLVMIPGMLIVAFVPTLAMVGTVIVILPYLVDTIVFIVVTFMLSMSCCVPPQVKNMSGTNVAKLQYVRKWFITVTAAWVVITIVGALSGIIKPVRGMDTMVVFLLIILAIAEFFAIMGTMMLTEMNMGPVVVIKDLVQWKYTDRSMRSMSMTTARKTDSIQTGADTNATTVTVVTSASNSTSEAP